MKTLSIFVILLILNTYTSSAQEKNQIEVANSIESLSFMQGTWQGSGWILKGKEKKEFIQKEIIEPRIDNTILVIDGLGYDKDSSSIDKQIIHNAFGVISYNEEMNAMTMLSFSSTGGKMENEIRIIGERKLEWSFKDDRGGTIRFTEDFSSDGLWIENGEYSHDGKNWFTFFFMKLERIHD